MLRGKAASPKYLRDRYTKIWSQPWPHDDDYLRVLIREVGQDAWQRYPMLRVLDLMRETHDFGVK